METADSLYTTVEAWLVERECLNFITSLAVCWDLCALCGAVKAKRGGACAGSTAKVLDGTFCASQVLYKFSLKSGLTRRSGDLTHWAVLLCIHYEILKGLTSQSCNSLWKCCCFTIFVRSWSSQGVLSHAKLAKRMSGGEFHLKRCFLLASMS